MIMKSFLSTICVTLILSVSSGAVHADNIPYYNKVTLNVGQSAVLKGVRHKNCDSKRAPGSFGKLPKTKLGKFKRGKKGTINSVSCGKEVPARELIFVARKRGTEKLIVKGDPITITVK
jgi:hypothetical protein